MEKTEGGKDGEKWRVCSRVKIFFYKSTHILVLMDEVTHVHMGFFGRASTFSTCNTGNTSGSSPVLVDVVNKHWSVLRSI